ncbi:transglycosylase domain-containing protein [Flavobacterium sp. RHBU_3]|uniref:transglycosylase domain-containing protein n=1 Tax=Flavobacterium sp. RHBU_3 TaxID=3391184 RepID=UPI003984D6D4
MYLKILKKTLRYSLAFIGLLIAGLFLWLNFGVYTFTNSVERDEIISQVKNAPALPESFLEIYGKVNQEQMNRSVYSWFLNWANGHNYSQPHIDASAEWAMDHRKGYMQNIAAMAFFLNRNVSKEECVQFLFARKNFYHNCIGVEQAALFYYKKPLNSLSDDEMIGLIAMYPYPSLYNPLGSNRRFHDRFESLNKKYIQATKH